jgi:hypothetical protein
MSNPRNYFSHCAGQASRKDAEGVDEEPGEDEFKELAERGLG